MTNNFSNFSQSFIAMIAKYEIYCEWDCRNQTNAILMIINLLIAFALLLFSIKAYRQYRRRLMPGIEKFYYCLIAWGISYCIKNVFSLIVFYEKFSNFEETYLWNEENRYDIKKFSAIYLIMDLIPPLTLQTLLFIIPYHIYGRIMRILINYGDSISSKETLFYQILTVYSYLRFLIVVPWFMLCFFKFADDSFLEIASQISVAMICFDCLVCCILLLFNYRYLSQKYDSLNMSQEQYRESLKLQCILLFFSAIFRFGIDLYFYVVQPIILWKIPDESRQTCFAQSNLVYTVCYVVLGSLLMHFFPVVVSLYAYTPR